MDWKYECVPVDLRTGEILTDFGRSELEISLDEIKLFLDTANTDHTLNDEGPFIGMMVLPVIIS